MLQPCSTGDDVHGRLLLLQFFGAGVGEVDHGAEHLQIGHQRIHLGGDAVPLPATGDRLRIALQQRLLIAPAGVGLGPQVGSRRWRYPRRYRARRAKRWVRQVLARSGRSRAGVLGQEGVVRHQAFRHQRLRVACRWA